MAPPWTFWQHGEEEEGDPSSSQEGETTRLLRPREADNAQVAGGKAISFLHKIDHHGSLGVTRESVYGAAIALPQIARSSGWAATYLALSIRSFLFLLVSMFLQGFLLMVMNEEARIMSPEAGQMHLCDFGASISSCPDGPNCRGPGGTSYTFPRVRSFDSYATRSFLRSALRELFPDRAEEVDAVADPGEYGLEDYYCRLVCCLLFVMAVYDDFNSTVRMGFLIYKVPTKEEPWLQYQKPDWMSKSEAKKLHGWSELDLVKFQVAGIPLIWKVYAVLFVLVPKAYIWFTLTSTGFYFLMETAGITDLVVNCMALKFVLKVDQIVFARLAAHSTAYIMKNLEDFCLFDTSREEAETQQQAAERFVREELGERWTSWRKTLRLIIPVRFLYIGLTMALMLCKYYWTNCDRLEDGSWVSKPIYQPKHVAYHPLAFLYGLGADESTEPVWSMPEKT